jgi:two-component system phosphate regulon response regulator PhoB
MVLEEDDPEDRRRALRAGADDYVIGPLTRTAVLDRVLALQSRGAERHATRRFEAGALSIDMAALQARWNGEPIMLRPNEFRLLRFFAENPNRVLTREDLISGLGKREPPIDERTVDVWIGRLRRAIKAAGGGNPLRTVRSIGYVFDLNWGAWIDHPNRAPERIRDVMLEAADALEAKEREHPSNCNCGYGGFHEPENKNCEANQ